MDRRLALVRVTLMGQKYLLQEKNFLKPPAILRTSIATSVVKLSEILNSSRTFVKKQTSLFFRVILLTLILF